MTERQQRIRTVQAYINTFDEVIAAYTQKIRRCMAGRRESRKQRTLMQRELEALEALERGEAAPRAEGGTAVHGNEAGAER